MQFNQPTTSQPGRTNVMSTLQSQKPEAASYAPAKERVSVSDCSPVKGSFRKHPAEEKKAALVPSQSQSMMQNAPQFGISAQPSRGFRHEDRGFYGLPPQGQGPPGDRGGFQQNSGPSQGLGNFPPDQNFYQANRGDQFRQTLREEGHPNHQVPGGYQGQPWLPQQPPPGTQSQMPSGPPQYPPPPLGSQPQMPSGPRYYPPPPPGTQSRMTDGPPQYPPPPLGNQPQMPSGPQSYPPPPLGSQPQMPSGTPQYPSPGTQPQMPSGPPQYPHPPPGTQPQMPSAPPQNLQSEGFSAQPGFVISQELMEEFQQFQMFKQMQLMASGGPPAQQQWPQTPAAPSNFCQTIHNPPGQNRDQNQYHQPQPLSPRTLERGNNIDQKEPHRPWAQPSDSVQFSDPGINNGNKQPARPSDPAPERLPPHTPERPSGKTLVDSISEDIILIRKTLSVSKKLLTINDFMTLDYSYNYKKIISYLRVFWENQQSFQSDQILELLIHFVKNRASFSLVIKALDLVRNQNFKLSPTALFLFLLENADDNFKTFLFNVCSQYMPIPLYTRRYFSDEPNSFHCWTQALHVYEKQVNVISFELPNSKGKFASRPTEIINKVFGKSFQTDSFTKIDSGGTFIQFDHDCSAPRFQAVILKNGPAELGETEEAASSGAFDFIFLHYLVESEEDRAYLYKIIKAILTKSSTVRVYTLAQSQQEPQESLEKEGRFWIRHCEEFKYLEVDQRQMVFEKCWEDLKDDFFLFDDPQYESRFEAREQSKDSLLGFLRKVKWISEGEAVKFLEDKKKVMEVLSTIKNSEEVKGVDMLPMNFYYFKIGRKELKIREENADIDAQRRTEQLKRKKEAYMNEVQRMQATPLVENFLRILEQPGYLLQQQLWMTSYLKGLYKQRIAPIKNQIDDAKGRQIDPQEKKEDREAMIKKLEKQEASQMFSLELLFREIYFLSRHHQKFGRIYSRIVSQQIQSAQPIELIDGDNLLISDISQAIEHLFDSEFIGREQNITVVSIIGPQSSGKSLILKFLFGTQFFSSEGRCTKGVYYSLLKMKIKEGKFKYILLLDTEGIQSREARDPTFDSRIIFFIMCVSNIVLICNKQEMNAPMTATLQLVIDNWVNAKAEVSKNPKIFIIMNKMTELNEDLLKNAEREILSQIQTDEEKKLAKPKVFGVPMFFQAEDFGPGKDQVRPISKEFLDYVEELRKAIVEECEMEEIKNCQPFDKWFEQAQNLWKITDDFTGLHQYLSLKEKRDDFQLGKSVTDIVSRHFIHKESSNLYADLERSMKFLFANEVKTHSVISGKLNSIIVVKFDAMFTAAIENYEQDCKRWRLNPKLTQKYRASIERHRRAEENICRLEFDKKISARLLDLSREIGNQEVQDEVQHIVNQNYKLSEEEAHRAFEAIWEGAFLRRVKSNVNDKLYENINEFIRTEFSRLDVNLQRESFINELAARQQLLDSPQLEELRAEFRGILQSCNFLFRLNESRPGDSQLFELNNSRNTLVNVPRRLFTLRKVNRSYDFPTMVSKALHYLETAKMKHQNQMSDHFTLTIALYEARPKQSIINKISQAWNGSSQDSVTQVFNQLNAELVFLNLKFKADISKFHLAEQSSGEYMSKIDQIIIQEFQNRSNFQLLDHSREPSKIGKSLRFFKIDNYQEQNEYLRQVSQKEYKYYENLHNIPHHERGGISLEINQDICRRNNFSTDFMFFLKALFGEADSNKVSNKMVQEAISFLNFPKVFSLIEGIIAAQIIVNDGESINIPPREQLEELLRGLELPQNIQTDISRQVALNDKVVEQRQGVCERILNGISSEVIQLLEKEYQALNLGITAPGRSALFSYAQGIMATIWERKTLVAARIPIMDFLVQKDTELKLAVARLTCNDDSIDSSMAKHMVVTIQSHLEQHGKTKAHEDFKTLLTKELQVFEKRDIIFQVDKQALDLAKKQAGRIDRRLTHPEEEELGKIVEFYLDPKHALQTRATETFNSRKNTILHQIQAEYSQMLASSFNELLLFIKKLKDSLIQKGCSKGASEILKMSGGTHENARHSRTALAQYFVLFTSSSWRSGQELQVSENNKMISLKEAIELPKMNLHKLRSEVQIGITRAITTKSQISNLVSFCENVIQLVTEHLKGLIAQPDSLGSNLIIKDTLNQLINKYIGCLEVCPLCSRQCDQNHDEREQYDLRSHKCENGHQLQAMGGVHSSNTKRAITNLCEEITESESFRTPKTNGKWVHFKELKLIYNQWDFESELTRNAEKREKHRAKVVSIWNCIGPMYCKKSSQLSGYIEFVPASTDPDEVREISPIEKRHFIFVLDTSSGMKGQAFSDLQTSLNGFINNLRERQGSGTTVTIISYDDTPEVQVKEEAPENVHQINYIGGGGRNFTYALNAAHDCAILAGWRYLLTTIFFMSNGSGSKPDIKYWRESSIFGKLTFKVVAYGADSDQDLLLDIAEQAGGLFSFAKNAQQLQNSMLFLL